MKAATFLRSCATALFAWIMMSDLAHAQAGNSWSLRNPMPTNEYLQAAAWSGTLLATAGQGGALFTSADGVTWTARASGVTTAINGLTWVGSQFVAVGDAGVILTSPDGITWTKRTSGTAANLRAVGFTGSTIVAVGDTGTILTSPNGTTWTSRFSSVATSLKAVVWTGANLVVVGDSGVTLTSLTGVSWTLTSANATLAFTSIAYTGSQLVAVTSGGKVQTSPDGLAWTERYSGAQSLYVVVWAGSQAVVVGAAGTVLTSPTGNTWTTQSSGVPQQLLAVVSTGAQLVATGAGGIIITSPIGTTWTNRSQVTNANLRDVAWTGLEMIAVGQGGVALTSSNGDNWVLQSSGTAQDLEAATWTGTEVIAVGAAGTILGTTHGTTWSPRVSGTAQRLLDVAWTHALVIAVGENGTILTSPDGVTWTLRSSSTSAHLRSVTWMGSRAVAVGDGGTIVTSPDGITWTASVVLPFTNLNEVIWTGSQLVAVGDGDTILTSSNAITWTQRPVSFAQNLNGVAWTGSQLAAVGTSELILTSSNGIGWTKRLGTSPTLPALRNVQWFGTRLVAVGDAGTILVSGTAPAAAPVVSFTSTSQTVAEGIGSVNITAQLSFAPTSSLTVPFVLTGSTATLGSDYTISATPVTFAAGQTSKNITINVIDDVLVEAPETVKVSIADPAIALVGPANVFTLTITSPDVAPVITTQPVSHIASVGQASVSFTSAAAIGSPVITYQWRKNGSNISGATSGTYTITNAQLSHAAAYTMAAKNPTATAVSNIAELAVVNTAPANFAIPVGGTATIKITAAGNSLAYQWRKNGVDMSNDARTTGVTTSTLKITGLITGDTATYTCRVTAPGGILIGGNNALQVLVPPVVTPPTLPSTMVAAPYSFAVTAANFPSSFTASGLPPGLAINSVTGVISGRTTTPGTYLVRIKASNAAGSSAWVSAPLEVSTLPLGTVGSFLTLVDRSAAVNGSLGGRLEFTTTATGTVTGRLTQGASAYSFSTLLTTAYATAPQLVVTIPRPTPQPALHIALTLDGSINRAFGSMDTGGPTASVDGWRRVWNTTSNPLDSRTGYYSFALDIPGTAVGNVAIPQGSGFGSFTAAMDGGLTVTGRVADGSVFTSAGFVSPTGQVNVYQPLDSGLGSLHGLLLITPNGYTENTVTGTLTWSKPTNSSRLYAAGFAPLNLTAFGKYLAPASKGYVVLGLPVTTASVALRFYEGGLSLASINPNVNSFTFTDTLAVILPVAGSPSNPGKATLSISSSTGAVSGKFTLVDGSLTRTANYYGTIVRPQFGTNKAAGFFTLPQIPIGVQTINTSPILSGRMVIEQ